MLKMKGNKNSDLFKRRGELPFRIRSNIKYIKSNEYRPFNNTRVSSQHRAYVND